VAVRLFREREAPGPDRSTGPRTHRRAPVIALALLAGRIALPGPIASLLGAIPNRVPGSRWLFEAMSMHAYLRGAGQELHGYREWKAFLTRQRPGTTESS
jgi:hypothetical protein